jgi:hypothetical protein
VKGQNGFTEQINKNMLRLIWTFESSIDTMHGRNQDRELRQSMHKCRQGGWKIPESEALEKILAATANDAIDMCFHPDIRGGQKYDALGFRGKTTSRTPRLNFEQYVATMDGEDIEHWIKVC